MKKKSFIAYSTLLQFLYMLPTHAQGLKNANKQLSDIGKASGINTKQDVGTLAGGIISAALSLIGIIFLILMVYAGFLWMTAQGESEKIDKAKKMIVSALIGLVVVLSAYAITAFVTGSVASLG